MSLIEVSEVRFSPARQGDGDRGLLGFVSFVLNGAIRIDGVTLRQTRDERLTLSYPARRDRGGGEHPYVFPISDAARVVIQKQVFAALPRMVAIPKE